MHQQQQQTLSNGVDYVSIERDRPMDPNETFYPVSEQAFNAPSLNDADARAAADALIIPPLPFTRVNRRFRDPVRSDEPRFALWSFVKSDLGDGICGVAKIRGCFHTYEESLARSRELIKDVDSEHAIRCAIVGVPFPLVDNGFANETIEVDLEDKVNGVMERSDFEQRKRDRDEMKEMERRQKALIADATGVTPIDPFDTYVENRVKLAQLTYTITQHAVARRECMQARKRCKQYLRDESARNPDYETAYMNKYMEARRAAHIPENTDDTGFMKHMRDSIDEDELDVAASEPFVDDRPRPAKRRCCMIASEGADAACASDISVVGDEGMDVAVVPF